LACGDEPTAAFLVSLTMRCAVNPHPTSENDRFLTLFITNGGGW
jgi:hypothetical protein